MLSCPAKAGKGDRALARWKGRLDSRRNFCNDNEAPSQRPPPPRFAWSPSPALRGRIILPRSRDAPLRPSYCHATVRKPFVPRIFPHDLVRKPQRNFSGSCEKKGGGAPIGAPLESAPPAEQESLPAYAARALYSPPARIGAELKETARSPLGAPPRLCAEGFYPSDSAPGRASWNHRIRTGGPSPAPVQPAPGSPVTRRTVDAQSRPETRCMAAPPGTAPAPPRSTLAKASFTSGILILSIT